MESGFDIQEAHRWFSAECFNDTWTLIDKRDRTPEQDGEMVLGAMTSLWHWSQRPDCTPRNLSVGHWQVSRVLALTGQGVAALHHARRSLVLADGLEPIYLGYAHEAMSRAASILRNEAEFHEHLSMALGYADQVSDDQERQVLEDCLDDLEA